jgi:hypothetical protein
MSAAAGRRPVGVAVAGFGWMGRVHAQAYARAAGGELVPVEAGTWVEVADS